MESFFKRFSLIISLILCTVLNANALTINGITYKAAKSECKCGSIHVHVVGINDMQYKNNENIIEPKYIYILDKKNIMSKKLMMKY